MTPVEWSRSVGDIDWSELDDAYGSTVQVPEAPTSARCPWTNDPACRAHGAVGHGVAPGPPSTAAPLSPCRSWPTSPRPLMWMTHRAPRSPLSSRPSRRRTRPCSLDSEGSRGPAGGRPSDRPPVHRRVGPRRRVPPRSRPRTRSADRGLRRRTPRGTGRLPDGVRHRRRGTAQGGPRRARRAGARSGSSAAQLVRALAAGHELPPARPAQLTACAPDVGDFLGDITQWPTRVQRWWNWHASCAATPSPATGPRNDSGARRLSAPRPGGVVPSGQPTVRQPIRGLVVPRPTLIE